jgi:hypothetical protein
MLNFEQWCAEGERELPYAVIEAEGEKSAVLLGSAEGEGSTGEQRVRTGYSANYPPAYVRAQYPHQWFVPRKSTADLDQSHMKKS